MVQITISIYYLLRGKSSIKGVELDNVLDSNYQRITSQATQSVHVQNFIAPFVAVEIEFVSTHIVTQCNIFKVLYLTSLQGQAAFYVLM